MDRDVLAALRLALAARENEDRLPMRFSYGPRHGSTDLKDIGFRGPLKQPDGSVVSEYSSDRDFQYPSVYKGITDRDLATVMAHERMSAPKYRGEDEMSQRLNAAQPRIPFPEDVDDRAYAAARQRVEAGHSPFYEPGHDPYPQWSPEQNWEEPAIRDALRLARAMGGAADDEEAQPKKESLPPVSSEYLPVTADDQGLHLDWNAGIPGKLKRAGQYFYDTMSGQKEMDPTSQEAIDAANTIAGVITLGAGASTAPAEALRMGAARPYRDPKSQYIGDWKWRPLEEVQSEIGTNRVPEHVENFGKFMRDMSDKAATERLDPEDAIKAYMITRSSIQREGRTPEKLASYGIPVRQTDEPLIRPEGHMADFLASPMGVRFLNEARKGDLSQDVVEAAQKHMKPFGMSSVEPDAMDWARRNLPERTPIISNLVTKARSGESFPSEWRGFTLGVKGIGPAKAGFLGSLLGRGDLPTLDARQAILHTGLKNAEAQKIMQQKSGKAGHEAVDRLAARQRAMNFELPEELQPFYQHLAHHTVWDAIGKERTTHQDIIDAMRPRADGGEVQNALRLARKMGGAAKSKPHAPHGVIDLGDKIIVGSPHGETIDLSDDLKQRIRDVANKHGAWYEGTGGDIEPNKDLIPKYSGSWDDRHAKSVKGYPVEYLGGMFSNVDVNKPHEKFVDSNRSIMESLIVNQDKMKYFKDRSYDEKTLKDFFRQGSQDGVDFESMSQMPATKENLRKFFTAGERLTWPDNWQEYPNKLGKIAKKVEDQRNQFLLNAPPGVYVTGAGHIPELQRLRNDLQVIGGERAAYADGGTIERKEWNPFPGLKIQPPSEKLSDEPDIRDYQKARYEHEFHGAPEPEAPTRKVVLDAPLLGGKKELGELPYYLASPANTAVNAAYGLKTAPLYASEVGAPLARAIDAYETAKKVEENPTNPGSYTKMPKLFMGATPLGLAAGAAGAASGIVAEDEEPHRAHGGPIMNDIHAALRIAHKRIK